MAHVLENELHKDLSADKADFVRAIPGALGGGAATAPQQRRVPMERVRPDDQRDLSAPAASERQRVLP